ncbi:MAG: hypothetical protein P1U56_07695 [Saprospiraceae bacterium]|nr:hypothetical protein [Saprospiraceae bacterium]
MKKICCLFLLFSLCFGVNAQSEIEPIKEKQRYNALLFSGLFGASKTGLGLRYKSLYTFKKSIKIGWGVGIESYSSGIERNFIPLSLDILGDVLDSDKTPFYMVSVGYGIPLKEDVEFAEESKGGLMVDLSVGYRSRRGESQPFLTAGYRIQNASYLGEDSYGNNNKNVIYKRWSVTAGMLF